MGVLIFFKILILIISILILKYLFKKKVNKNALETSTLVHNQLTPVINSDDGSTKKATVVEAQNDQNTTRENTNNKTKQDALPIRANMSETSRPKVPIKKTEKTKGKKYDGQSYIGSKAVLSTSGKKRKCKDCGVEHPLTREYFGQYKNKSGSVTKIGFRNSCRKCMAQRTSQHSTQNPHLVKKRLDKRVKLEQNAKGFFTSTDIEKIRRELDDKCRFCNKPLKGQGEIDHLTPLSRGGTNKPTNLTLTCLNCNREKTNKTREEYHLWRTERKLRNRNISPPSENPDKPKVS